jgi:hypothetical protein
MEGYVLRAERYGSLYFVCIVPSSKLKNLQIYGVRTTNSYGTFFYMPLTSWHKLKVAPLSQVQLLTLVVDFVLEQIECEKVHQPLQENLKYLNFIPKAFG